MGQRTGVPAIIKVAKEMCRLINLFTPVIQKLYPTNTALLAALAAANAACGVLHLELEEVQTVGV